MLIGYSHLLLAYKKVVKKCFFTSGRILGISGMKTPSKIFSNCLPKKNLLTIYHYSLEVGLLTQFLRLWVTRIDSNLLITYCIPRRICLKILISRCYRMEIRRKTLKKYFLKRKIQSIISLWKYMKNFPNSLIHCISIFLSQKNLSVLEKKTIQQWMNVWI